VKYSKSSIFPLLSPGAAEASVRSVSRREQAIGAEDSMLSSHLPERPWNAWSGLRSLPAAGITVRAGSSSRRARFL